MHFDWWQICQNNKTNMRQMKGNKFNKTNNLDSSVLPIKYLRGVEYLLLLIEKSLAIPKKPQHHIG
jgi:hypothetical protein